MKMGGSYFKWYFVKKYIRRTPSPFHYPELSPVTGKQIDWMYAVPKSGYEGALIYGPHTLELKGMPMGRTPEYMQERLRRFFSKFGPIKMCRCVPHPLDPYQCEGTAFITFRTKYAALQALKAPLKFPTSLHSHIVRMRDLDSDKTNDPLYIYKAEHWNSEVLSLCRQLHSSLRANGPMDVQHCWRGLREREYGTKKIVAADEAVFRRFGSWSAMFSCPPFDELFCVSTEVERAERGPPPHSQISPPPVPTRVDVDMQGGVDDHPSVCGDALEETGGRETGAVRVSARLLGSEQMERVLVRCRGKLQRRLAAELQVYWREGRIELPDVIKKRVLAWTHAPQLPEEIQFMSRTKDFYRIHDEHVIFKMRLKREKKKRKDERKKEEIMAKRMLTEKSP